MKAWRHRTPGPQGKRPLTFAKSDAQFIDRPIIIPCGQCSGCRLDRSADFAVRCVHESRMHNKNCFITLTYDDDHLPKYDDLVYDHFQSFMKNLRHECPPGLKFYMCGEYGDKTQRPHYHALVFGHDLVIKRNIRCRERKYYILVPD